MCIKFRMSREEEKKYPTFNNQNQAAYPQKKLPISTGVASNSKLLAEVKNL